MTDLVGEIAVTFSDWAVAFTESRYFEMALLVMALLVLVGIARWMRWDRNTQIDNRSRRAEIARRGGRPEDV